MTIIVLGYIFAALLAYAMVLSWTYAGSYQWEDETIPDLWWFEAVQDSVTYREQPYVHRDASIPPAFAVCRSYAPHSASIRMLPRPQVIRDAPGPSGAPSASHRKCAESVHSGKGCSKPCAMTRCVKARPCKGQAKVKRTCKGRARAKNAPALERVTLRVLSE